MQTMFYSKSDSNIKTENKYTNYNGSRQNANDKVLYENGL